jgi:hypothetical protein
MSKKISAKKLLIISGKEAQKALSIGLDRYLEMTGHENKLSEFDALLQELKEDK